MHYQVLDQESKQAAARGECAAVLLRGGGRHRLHICVTPDDRGKSWRSCLPSLGVFSPGVGEGARMNEEELVWYGYMEPELTDLARLSVRYYEEEE